MFRRLLEALSHVVVRWPGQTVAVFAVLAALAISATALHLELKADQNDLVSGDLEYNRRFQQFRDDFAQAELIYVVVQVDDDPARAVRIVESLAAEIEPLKDRGLIEFQFHRLPLAELDYGLLLAETASLEELSGWVVDNRDWLTRLGAADRFEKLLELLVDVTAPTRLAEFQPGAEAEDGSADGSTDDSTDAGDAEAAARWGLRLLHTVLDPIDDALTGRDSRPLETDLELRAGLSLRERGYLATEGERFLLLEIAPARDTSTLEIIREPLEAIRAAITTVRGQFPEARIGLTGHPVFQADEMMTTDRDMTSATVIAIVGVFALFVVFFRRTKRPFLSILCLSVAISLTFGLVTVTIGHLNLLTIVFAAMLVGLGIDFGIHLVARYQEELTRGRGADEAARVALVTTGTSIGTGAFTTSAAFFSALLVDFRALRQLGFIAGVGVLICFVTMVTLLPALLVLVDRWVERRRPLEPAPVRSVPLIDRLASRPRAVLGVAIALTLIGVPGILFVRYDYNLLELQAQGLESVEYERLLIEESDAATWHGAFVVDNLAEADRIVTALEPLQAAGVVGLVENPRDVMPRDQETKIRVLARAHAATRDIALAEPSAEVDPTTLVAALEDLLDNLDEIQDFLLRQEVSGDSDDSGDAGMRGLLEEFAALAERVESLAERIAGDPESASRQLGSRQQPWFGELRALIGKLRGALQPRELRPDTLPGALHRRYVSRDDRQLVVYASPRKDIWEEGNLEEFTTAIRSVDSRATGSPITLFESARLMREGFVKGAVYSLLAVFLLLLIDMRRLSRAALATVPLAFGLFWLLETVPAVGLSFNLANFFAVPILIGCGVDGGVHLVHRFEETGSTADLRRNTCTAVALSFLTTMIGFGAMSFASHRGVASLGRMMVTGLTCLLVASVVLLPALLAIIEARRGRAATPESAEVSETGP